MLLKDTDCWYLFTNLQNRIKAMKLTEDKIQACNIEVTDFSTCEKKIVY